MVIIFAHLRAAGLGIMNPDFESWPRGAGLSRRPYTDLSLDLKTIQFSASSRADYEINANHAAARQFEKAGLKI
jgi:hypothetical protein